MCCEEDNDGIVKDREEEKMNTDNHKNIQEDLVNRYLNADTTIEEEHLLADFLSKNRESLSPEEEDVYLLLQASARDTDHFELSLEEAREFDRLMAAKPHLRKKKAPIYWIASTAAAIICAFVLLTGKHTGVSDQQAPVAIASISKTDDTFEKEHDAVFQPPKGISKNARQHTPTTKSVVKRKYKSKNRSVVKKKQGIDNAQRAKEMMKAANFQDEQVESYQLRPAGDVMIVTKTPKDGPSSSFIIHANDEGNSYRVMPINM